MKRLLLGILAAASLMAQPTVPISNARFGGVNKVLGTGSLSLLGSTSGEITFGAPATVTSYTFKFPSDDGTSGYVLQTDGSGNTSWVAQSGGGGTPGGSTTQVQFNLSGAFAGDADMTFVTDTLTVTKGILGGVSLIANAITNANSVTTQAATDLALVPGINKTVQVAGGELSPTIATKASMSVRGPANGTGDIFQAHGVNGGINNPLFRIGNNGQIISNTSMILSGSNDPAVDYSTYSFVTVPSMLAIQPDTASGSGIIVQTSGALDALRVYQGTGAGTLVFSAQSDGTLLGPPTGTWTITAGGSGSSVALNAASGGNASINLTAKGTGGILATLGTGGAFLVNGAATVNVMGVRAETDGNLQIRPYSTLNGSGTGFALDSLNDASNTVEGVYIRGAPIKLNGATTFVTSLTSPAITDSGLTATRVVFAGTGGLLSNDSDMTFATDTLTVTKIIGSTSIADTGLTATRVTFAGTAGLLADDSDLVFATDTLTFTKGLTTSLLSTSGNTLILGTTSFGTSMTFASATGVPTHATQIGLLSSAAPTTSTAGELAFDNNAWAASRGAAAVFDGTATTWLVGTLASDTPTNGQVPTWNTGGTITWETPTAGAAVADNTASIGLARVQGSASTAMRSDGAPPLDQSIAPTWTAEHIHSKSGAASVTAEKWTGVPFAGTGTTSFPLVYINDTNATASTTLNTAGTYLGVNGDGTQDLINLLKDGTSQFKVNSAGGVSVTGAIAVAGTGTSSIAGSVINLGANFGTVSVYGGGGGNGSGSRMVVYGSGATSGSLTLQATDNSSTTADFVDIRTGNSGAPNTVRMAHSGALLVNSTTDDATNKLQVTGSATISSNLTVGGGAALIKFLTATATLDFGSILAAGNADLTIAVTGAVVGDTVAISLPATVLAGAVFNGWVSAADTVNIRCNNAGSIAVDPASATYRATVLRF